MLAMASMPGWLLESWVEYSIAMAVSLLRLLLRTRLHGIRRWQGDDYLALSAMVFYSFYVISFQVSYDYGTNSHLEQAEVDIMTAAQKHNIRVGSGWHFMAFYAWAGSLWSLKGCMLFFYSRLTMGLWQHWMVKFTAWICILTLIGAWIASTVKCGLPVSINWQVDPIPPRRCPSGYIMYFYMGPSNLITDVLILCIPFPLVSHLKSLNKKKRILLYCLFGSGAIIVVICGLRIILSILGVYGIFPAASELGYRLSWSSRENFTSVIIVSVPIIFGCLQGIFRKDRHLTSRGKGSNNTLSINDLDDGKPIFSKHLSKMQTAAEIGPNIDLEKQGDDLNIGNFTTPVEPSQGGSARFGRMSGKFPGNKTKVSALKHVKNIDTIASADTLQYPEKAKKGNDTV